MLGQEDGGGEQGQHADRVEQLRALALAHHESERHADHDDDGRHRTDGDEQEWDVRDVDPVEREQDDPQERLHGCEHGHGGGLPVDDVHEIDGCDPEQVERAAFDLLGNRVDGDGATDERREEEQEGQEDGVGEPEVGAGRHLAGERDGRILQERRADVPLLALEGLEDLSQLDDHQCRPDAPLRRGGLDRDAAIRLSGGYHHRVHRAVLEPLKRGRVAPVDRRPRAVGLIDRGHETLVGLAGDADFDLAGGAGPRVVQRGQPDDEERGERSHEQLDEQGEHDGLLAGQRGQIPSRDGESWIRNHRDSPPYSCKRSESPSTP